MRKFVKTKLCEVSTEKVNEKRFDFGGSVVFSDGYNFCGDVMFYNPFRKEKVKHLQHFLKDRYSSFRVFRMKTFSENHSSYVAMTTRKSLFLYDLSGQTLTSFKSPGVLQGVDHIGFNGYTNGLLASCCMNGRVRLYNVEKKKCIHEFFDTTSDCMRQVRFVDKRTLFVSNDSSELLKFDVEKSVLLRRYQHDFFWNFDVIKSRRWLLCPSYGNSERGEPGTKTLYVIDADHPEKPIHMLPHSKPLFIATHTSDGNFISSSNIEKDNHIYQWDPRRLKRVRKELKISEYRKEKKGEDGSGYQNEGGVKDIVDIPELKSFAICCQGEGTGIVQFFDYELDEEKKKKKTEYYYPSFRCYSLAYFPLHSTMTMKKNKIDSKVTDEVYDLIEEEFSNVVFLGLRLWKSLFLRDDFEVVSKLWKSEDENVVDQIEETKILKILIPSSDHSMFHQTSSSFSSTENFSFSSALEAIQYYNFFKNFRVSHAMRRIIQKIKESRDIQFLMDIIETETVKQIVQWDLKDDQNQERKSHQIDVSALTNEAMNSLARMVKSGGETESILISYEKENILPDQQKIVEYVRKCHIVTPYRKHNDFVSLDLPFYKNSEDEEEEEDLCYQYYSSNEEFEYYMKMLNEDREVHKKYTNLVLCCSDNPSIEFSVHQELITARSEFFFRMFRFGGKEMEDRSKKGKVTLEILKSRILKHYLKFLYCQGIFSSNNPCQDDEKYVDVQLSCLDILVELLFHSDMFGECELQVHVLDVFLEIWSSGKCDLEEFKKWVEVNSEKITMNENVRNLIVPILLTKLKPDDSVMEKIGFLE